MNFTQGITKPPTKRANRPIWSCENCRSHDDSHSNPLLLIVNKRQAQQRLADPDVDRPMWHALHEDCTPFNIHQLAQFRSTRTRHLSTWSNVAYWITAGLANSDWFGETNYDTAIVAAKQASG